MTADERIVTLEDRLKQALEAVLATCDCQVSTRKEVNIVEWITPDFEEYELESEVTAYMDHW
jgi:hypothetical protein